jgi:hypothetical protein
MNDREKVYDSYLGGYIGTELTAAAAKDLANKSAYALGALHREHSALLHEEVHGPRVLHAKSGLWSCGQVLEQIRRMIPSGVPVDVDAMLSAGAQLAKENEELKKLLADKQRQIVELKGPQPEDDTPPSGGYPWEDPKPEDGKKGPKHAG